MKIVLFILALFLVGTVTAADSGNYFNPDRPGEGINVTRNGDTFLWYFYTYGARTCPDPDKPTVSPVPDEPECTYNGQRWFYGVNDIDGDEVDGTLLLTAGVNYPVGIGNAVGKEIEVGSYSLIRHHEGWLLFVIRGDHSALDADDFLFDTIFDFDTALLPATD